FIVPRAFVVGLFLRIKSGVEPIFRKLESLFDDEGSVRVVDYVVFRDPVILERVVNQSAEKRYIRAGSNLAEKIGSGSGACKARIHHDHLGIAIAFRFYRPLETA